MLTSVSKIKQASQSKRVVKLLQLIKGTLLQTRLQHFLSTFFWCWRLVGINSYLTHIIDVNCSYTHFIISHIQSAIWRYHNDWNDVMKGGCMIILSTALQCELERYNIEYIMLSWSHRLSTYTIFGIDCRQVRYMFSAELHN